ncbi:MAG: response regulator [Myxococcota bacterium]|jgi:DNA-binding response OmpR family regulator
MNQNVVLLVEDEALIMMDVQEGLEEAGFTVHCAKDAAEALARFDRNPTGIRAVVTDIKLGNGDTGWDIAFHIRQAIPTMPIVYMSGDSAADWPARGVPNSVMVQKPFAMAQIIAAVTTLLNALPPIASD